MDNTVVKMFMLMASIFYMAQRGDAIPLSAMTQKSIQLYSAIEQQIVNSGFNLDISSITSEINNAGQPTITYSVYLRVNNMNGVFKAPENSQAQLSLLRTSFQQTTVAPLKYLSSCFTELLLDPFSHHMVPFWKLTYQ